MIIFFFFLLFLFFAIDPNFRIFYIISPTLLSHSSSSLGACIDDATAIHGTWIMWVLFKKTPHGYRFAEAVYQNSAAISARRNEPYWPVGVKPSAALAPFLEPVCLSCFATFYYFAFWSIWPYPHYGARAGVGAKE